MGGLKKVIVPSRPPTPVAIAPSILISQKKAELTGGTVHKTMVRRASLIGGK